MQLKVWRRFLFALALLFPVAAYAQALPCAAYPNTLTNGTLADANQVMANFNTIRNCVNNLAPIGVPVAGSASNVKSAVTVGPTTTVTADNIIVGTALNGTLYTLTNYSQTFNGATVGAGGMDTGTLPSSGYVALYAIYNPAGPTISILGTNAASSAPTIYAGANMPAGYTASALLAILPTNATPALQAGVVRNRFFEYASSIVVLNNSSTNQASFTSLSVAAAVPTSAISITSGVAVISTTASVTLTGLQVNIGHSSAGNSYEMGYLSTSGVSASYAGNYGFLMLPTAQTIWYSTAGISANATLTITVSGYNW